MMLDVINLPVPTMKECSLSDLPLVLAGKVSYFLIDGEVPNLCILKKVELGWVSVYAVTPFCVIRVSNKIKNGVLITDDWENTSSCLFLSAIKKIECNWGKKDGRVTLRGDSLDLIEFYEFIDIDLLNKFETVIFSLNRQNHRPE